jgi:Chaperone of endosialidase
MDKDASANGKGEAKPIPDRKPYHPPEFQVFGKLHLLTQGSGPANGDGGQGMMRAMSDRRAKEDIVRIGTHRLGMGIYLFRFKVEYRERYGHGRQFGVMADEVETVMPEAVSVHPDGYKRVHYGMLGLRRAIR